MAEIAMQFLLDNNVPNSVAQFLQRRGYSVYLVRDILLPDSPDQLIATVSEENGWILVSADHDFEKIAPRIPRGSQRRFRKLSRISLQCTEYQAAARLEKCMPHVELAFESSRVDESPMRIVIQNNGFKIIG